MTATPSCRPRQPPRHSTSVVASSVCGANNPVVWKPVAGKTMVTVNLKSGSGIGMWYGQLDTSNPSGYITWDGGANRALRFIYENTGSSANRAIPFFFGQGASNYTDQERDDRADQRRRQADATTLPMPTYNATFNQFTLLDGSEHPRSRRASCCATRRRSTWRAERNSSNRDTLRNQNNRFENNEIRGFGYGIASVGAGPLLNVGRSRYTEYPNQNNVYTNNLIENVSRAGIVVAFEKGSQIIGNTIRRVNNNSTTVPHAAGISATAGGNTTNNRGYSTRSAIERNKISTGSRRRTGNAAAISIETNENVLHHAVEQTCIASRQGGATNMRIWNNMALGLQRSRRHGGHRADAGSDDA